MTVCIVHDRYSVTLYPGGRVVILRAGAWIGSGVWQNGTLDMAGAFLADHDRCAIEHKLIAATSHAGRD